MSGYPFQLQQHQQHVYATAPVATAPPGTITQQQQQQQQQQQSGGGGVAGIDPQLLQSLYPQAFQALALQQQLAAMAAAQKGGTPTVLTPQFYQAALQAA